MPPRAALLSAARALGLHAMGLVLADELVEHGPAAMARRARGLVALVRPSPWHPMRRAIRLLALFARKLAREVELSSRCPCWLRSALAPNPVLPPLRGRTAAYGSPVPTTAPPCRGAESR